MTVGVMIRDSERTPAKRTHTAAAREGVNFVERGSHEWNPSSHQNSKYIDIEKAAAARRLQRGGRSARWYQEGQATQRAKHDSYIRSCRAHATPGFDATYHVTGT